jgi:hypothetical protein
MITIPDALQVLRPGAEWVLRGNEYSGLEWLDQVQTKPTEEEVQDEITTLTLQEPFDACKAEAKQRLANTDWSVLPDVVVKNKLEFETYRSQIRELVLNPVADPVWPTEPQPVWS